MDAIEILIRDHEKMSHLLNQAAAERNTERLRVIVRQLRDEFLAHSHVEETVFYPPFARHEEIAVLIDSFYEEHHRLKLVFHDINRLDGTTLSQLMENISPLLRRHFDQEQDQLFTVVKRLMRRPEREQLGRHMIAAKNEKVIAA
jgi:hemerythrin superfamily protein